MLETLASIVMIFLRGGALYMFIAAIYVNILIKGQNVLQGQIQTLVTNNILYIGNTLNISHMEIYINMPDILTNI